jgi:hypothetical protein
MREAIEELCGTRESANNFAGTRSPHGTTTRPQACTSPAKKPMLGCQSWKQVRIPLFRNAEMDTDVTLSYIPRCSISSSAFFLSTPQR